MCYEAFIVEDGKIYASAERKVGLMWQREIRVFHEYEWSVV